MLFEFTVSNFRSFSTPQTLSMAASAKFRDHLDHRIPIEGLEESLLKACVLYGGNGAGKSNLVKAMKFAQDLVLFGVGPIKRLASDQFRFTEDGVQPTSFEFVYLYDDRLFDYRFSIQDEVVVEEELSCWTSSGKEKEVFSRRLDEITVGGNLKDIGDPDNTSRDALKALLQLGTRANQLLLNKIVDLDEKKRGRILNQASKWFEESLQVFQPHSAAPMFPSFASFGDLLSMLDEDKSFTSYAEAFLQAVGTGIEKLHVDKTPIAADQLPKELVNVLQSTDPEMAVITSGSGMDFKLDEKYSSKIIRRNLITHHFVNGKEYTLPFSSASDGTQRFLEMLPAPYREKEDGTAMKVFVIDEFDRSLHPLLSHSLLKFFVECGVEASQQIIVTTHETHLLDRDLLRRDEIWFVEKDENQSTQLFSLSDFKIRNDLRLEKGYIQGRFGGIPMIQSSYMEKLKDILKSQP